MNLQSPFGGDFSTSKPKIDGHDEPASPPPSVYYRRVAELKVCLATSCEFVPQIYAFAAILSGREEERERGPVTHDGGGKCVFCSVCKLGSVCR